MFDEPTVTIWTFKPLFRHNGLPTYVLPLELEEVYKWKSSLNLVKSDHIELNGANLSFHCIDPGPTRKNADRKNLLNFLASI